MEYEFTGNLIEWRGPAPFYFLPLPLDIAKELITMSSQLTYGWGVIPVTAFIGKTEYTTSLFPKDGTYYLPIKNAVRLPEKLDLEHPVSVRMVFSN